MQNIEDTKKTPPQQHISPDPIFQMDTGFWVSKTLMTAVELELFTKLSGNRKVNIKELQGILGMEQRPTEVFATALVSLGLLKLSNAVSPPPSPSSIGDVNNNNRLYSNSELADKFLDKKQTDWLYGRFYNYVGQAVL